MGESSGVDGWRQTGGAVKPDDLDAIRLRDGCWNQSVSLDQSQSTYDRRALLALVDELRAELAALKAAARKVTCAMCGGEGTIPDWAPDNSLLDASCPDCADLRKILEGGR